MSLELPVNETASETPNDYSNLPASAFPAGVDPATYAQSLNKAEPETPSKPERPAHVPEKFWDAEKGEARWEDMAKSYAELEAKFSGKTEDPAKADSLKLSTEEPKAEDATTPIASAFATFATAYETTKGQPTEADIKALTDLGIPKDIIERFMLGQEALGRESFNNAYTAAGGEDAYNSAMAWAESTFSIEDRVSFNTLVENPSTARQGIEWLMAKFNAARPAEGSLIEADADNATGDVFRSNAEVSGMIRDPRYKTDPAFRQDVMDKLQRTRDAGITL